MLALDRVVDALRAKGCEPVKNGKGMKAKCPGHDDTRPSLSIDHKDGKVLLCCRSANCPNASIVSALGLQFSDLFDDPKAADKSSREEKIQAIYDYRDESDNLLYQAVRLWAPPPTNKTFLQRRPDGKGGWIWKVAGEVRLVVFRLRELLAALPTETVFIAEGEKDVLTLERCGLVGTTNVGGAGKWKDEYAEWFSGRKVIVLQDNDKAGRDHAKKVRNSITGVVSSVKVVALPGLPEKGDVTDWVNAKVRGIKGDVNYRAIGDELLRLCNESTEAEEKASPATKADTFDPGISLADLVKTDLAPPRFVVNDLLPEGLTILAGRPKQGKSWLAMLSGINVASGSRCLGTEIVTGRDVLHLALEDTRRRYKDRAVKMLTGLGTNPPERLEVRTNWPRAGSGGLSGIEEWLKAHKGGLVIIDTLARFRDPPKNRGNSYDEDYRALSELKSLADKYEAAILVIHHTRKGSAEDPFDEISGTLGINGAADGLMVLDRQRGVDSAALYITGRDLPDQTISLAWNGDSGLWAFVNRADGIERPERMEGKSEKKIERCASWLLKAGLEYFAFTDSELTHAGEKQGFTPDNIKRAKMELRKNNPPLHSRKRGFGEGEWWNWIGEYTRPPPDRTPEALSELLR